MEILCASDRCTQSFDQLLVSPASLKKHILQCMKITYSCMKITRKSRIIRLPNCPQPSTLHHNWRAIKERHRTFKRKYISVTSSLNHAVNIVSVINLNEWWKSTCKVRIACKCLQSRCEVVPPLLGCSLPASKLLDCTLPWSWVLPKPPTKQKHNFMSHQLANYIKTICGR